MGAGCGAVICAPMRPSSTAFICIARYFEKIRTCARPPAVNQSPGCGVGFMATYADELESPSAGDSPPCPFLELYREYLRFISRLEAAEKVLDRHRTSNVAI